MSQIPPIPTLQSNPLAPVNQGPTGPVRSTLTPVAEAAQQAGHAVLKTQDGTFILVAIVGVSEADYIKLKSTGLTLDNWDLRGHSLPIMKIGDVPIPTIPDPNAPSSAGAASQPPPSAPPAA